MMRPTLAGAVMALSLLCSAAHSAQVVHLADIKSIPPGPTATKLR
jgi:hypothetical protein